eukprot:11858-Heterococcus_DN1.PRE.3
MVLRQTASLLVFAALTQLVQLSEALLSAPLAQQKCVYSSSSAFTQVDRVRSQRSVATQRAVRHAHTSPVMVFDFFKERASEGIKQVTANHKLYYALTCACISTMQYAPCMAAAVACVVGSFHHCWPRSMACRLVVQVGNIAGKTAQGKLGEALQDTAKYVKVRQTADAESIAKFTDGLKKSR